MHSTIIAEAANVQPQAHAYMPSAGTVHTHTHTHSVTQVWRVYTRDYMNYVPVCVRTS